ncbi:MAG TPA: LysR family transcriptional regulator [Gammaproteobacteria bacterium]|nr:LysR family transcriptional regulator [Gammaproteobacteria bacterium]
MMDWDHVRYFLQVVRSGSVSRAARRMGVNQTTVSRRIAALEENLGTHLFERSGKQWLITGIGERLIDAAEKMDDDANAFERQVLADSQELSGLLRVTVADVCTQHLIMPVIQAFVSRYPDIDLELIATRDELNLAAREADIALRTTDEPPPNLIGKRVARLGYAVYASEKIVRQLQAAPDDGSVPCITWVGDGHTRPAWIEKNFPNTRRVYRTTELGLMLRMAETGLGMAQMPCVFCDHVPSLRRIPAQYVEPGWGLWVLSHVDLRTTARVRIFRDFLVRELENNRAQIEGGV